MIIGQIVVAVHSDWSVAKHPAHIWALMNCIMKEMASKNNEGLFYSVKKKNKTVTAGVFSHEIMTPVRPMVL